jgi:NDP-sugar pyrophosphorylase family protein
MRQGVILAGGRSLRMRPYTDDRPKAMVEVAGAPILEHQIRWLVANGIETVVLSVGYRADVIQNHFGEGSRHGLKITYAVEDEPLGRGGGLKLAARMLPYPDEGWFGINGDVIVEFDLDQLRKRHESIGATATVGLAPFVTSWGLAKLEGDFIVGFEQSPKLPYWVNAGIYAMNPEVVDLLPDKGDHEDSTFPDLATRRKLGAFMIEGYWRPIDTVKDVEEATKELSR